MDRLGNSRGFGLIQALIGIGMVSAFALAVAQISVNASQSQKSLSNLQALSQYVQRSIYYLSKKQICNQSSIIGMSFNSKMEELPLPPLMDAFGDELFPSADTGNTGWNFKVKIGKTAQLPGEAPCDSSQSSCSYIGKLIVHATPSKTMTSTVSSKVFTEEIYLKVSGANPGTWTPVTECSLQTPVSSSAQIDALPLRIYFTVIDLHGSDEYCRWFIGDPQDSTKKLFPVSSSSIKTDGGTDMNMNECHSKTIAYIQANGTKISNALNQQLENKHIVTAVSGPFVSLPDSPFATKHASATSWKDLGSTFQIIYKEE